MKSHPTLVGITVDEDGNIFKDGKELRKGRHSGGYIYVHFNGRSYLHHVLVCEAWHGLKPSPELEVRHLDGSRTFNDPVNLCWGTIFENAEDRARHGRQIIGMTHPMRKITEDQAREIKWRIWAGEQDTAIARTMGLPSRLIPKDIRARRTWRVLSIAGEEHLDDPAPQR